MVVQIAPDAKTIGLELDVTFTATRMATTAILATILDVTDTALAF
jgi:hypothetical protein